MACLTGVFNLSSTKRQTIYNLIGQTGFCLTGVHNHLEFLTTNPVTYVAQMNEGGKN